MAITEYQIIEYIQFKRLLDFFKSRSESEQDMAKIAMSYHVSKVIRDKKILGQPVTEKEEEELSIFMELQKKYNFDYLKEITDEEIKNTKDDLLMNHGIF